MGHRGLHPDPEDVEFEQTQLLHVVLVELAHRKTRETGLDRGAVEQGRIGEQHPAGVHRDMAGQPVEAFDQTEHQVESFLGQAGGPQLGKIPQRGPGVTGPDVGKHLRDRVDLRRRHPQRRPDITHRVPDAIGVHHRDAHASFPAVGVEDRLIDLQPSRRLHVDVDVGKGPSEW